MLNFDITTLHNEYKNRTISPVEVLEWLYARIDRFSGLNAYVTVCKEEALQQAKKAEELFKKETDHNILLGIPIGLKDLIHTKGIRTTMGSGAYKDFIPTEDAEVVKKIKATGSVLVGKQNTHELAYGTTGDDSFFGPMKNPYNTNKIAGGSSGGSASATAANLCWASLGTDTSGSVRIPSALCGVVGMKPTQGKINNSGIQPLSWSMDTVGPITRTVLDNAIIFDAISGLLGSSQSVSRKLKEYPLRSLNDKKLGIPTSYFYENVDVEVKRKVMDAIKVFESLGATILEVDLDIPEMDQAMEISSAIDRAEAYLIHQSIANDYNNLLGNETRRRILHGAEYRAYEHILAKQLKSKLTAKYKQAFDTVDAIITPTVPILSTDVGADTVIIDGSTQSVRSALMRFTFFANYIGIPGMTMPCGKAENGLPIGVQLLGHWDHEEVLYLIAYELETALHLSKELSIV
ncbi:amidase [Siminovitchia fordii]|uniref:Amidase n=1 Tax=Siminovitchia fordii TaxID=254759 RepID=A0ABQ4K9Z8_9BACI|nr:amidase [Siminovitchia fordii]GIN22037.1 amidase [Siminovitchia fordii]